MPIAFKGIDLIADGNFCTASLNRSHFAIIGYKPLGSLRKRVDIVEFVGQTWISYPDIEVEDCINSCAGTVYTGKDGKR